MAVTLSIDNFHSLNKGEVSNLVTEVNDAGTSAVVASSQGYALGDYLYIGYSGSEQAEITTISAVAGTTITISATKHPHAVGEPTTKLIGNQVRIYTAANVDGTAPADGLFSVLAAYDIDYDQNQTIITDDTGDNDTWYKYTFYNSTSESETDITSAVAVRGNASSTAYCSIDDIKTEAGLNNNRNIKDATYDFYRQAAMNEINSALTGIYTIPFTKPVPATIRLLTAMLGAGRLLTSSVGGSFGSASNEGNEKLTQARAELMKLKTGESVLIDESGTSTATSVSGGFKAFPDSLSVNNTWHEGGRAFSQTDRY